MQMFIWLTFCFDFCFVMWLHTVKKHSWWVTHLIEWWIKSMKFESPSITVGDHQYKSQETALAQPQHMQHLHVTPTVSPSMLWLSEFVQLFRCVYTKTKERHLKTFAYLHDYMQIQTSKLQWCDKCNLAMAVVHSQVWDWCHHADKVGDGPISWMGHTWRVHFGGANLLEWMRK